MPRHHLESDHDELIDNKDSEGNTDHAVTINTADKNLTEPLNDAALVDANEDPDEEGAVTKGGAGGEFFVKFWVEVCEAFINIGV